VDTISLLFEGLALAFSPKYLLLCLAGVALGTLVGALPGIGAVAAVAMLLPLSYGLDPVGAIIFLAGVYYGSDYGGSIGAILLNLPGTPSTVVTSFDGHPMTLQGRGGVALMLTALCSFAGAMLGVTVLILASPWILEIARSFGSAEYFALMFLGLMVATVINNSAIVKGLIMMVLGILVGLIGLDINTGATRFTLGIEYLYPGLNLVIVAMGLFGVSELLLGLRRLQADRQDGGEPAPANPGRYLPTGKEARQAVAPALRGGLIGAFLGALPGTGPSIASFIAYAVEKTISRDPASFGKGNVAGISAPEASNNAAAQTAFLPTLFLGLPGSATMVVMLAALTLHGITPGPDLTTRHPELFWGLVGSFLIGNVMLLILNIPLIRLWIRILLIPGDYLYPIMLVMICIGAYAVQGSALDVVAVVVFGLAGLYFRVYGYPLAPFLMGFILGPLMEENFRRTMRIADGNVAYFLERPVALGILIASAVLIVLSLLLRNRVIIADRGGRTGTPSRH
jgi:TctA family transporter